MRQEERRAVILRAAIECFADRGYHATQISDIVRRAGVARGTFYLYFKSKHEIFHTILDEFMRDISACIETIDLSSPTPPPIQMRANVERVVGAIAERPEVARILFNEAVGLDGEIDARLDEFYGGLIGRIAASIRKGIALGLVKESNPEIAACIIIGAVKELMIQSAFFRRISADRQAIVDGLMEALVKGMGAGPLLGG